LTEEKLCVSCAQTVIKWLRGQVKLSDVSRDDIPIPFLIETLHEELEKLKPPVVGEVGGEPTEEQKEVSKRYLKPILLQLGNGRHYFTTRDVRLALREARRRHLYLRKVTDENLLRRVREMAQDKEHLSDEYALARYKGEPGHFCLAKIQ
jgi:hypothetical protein